MWFYLMASYGDMGGFLSVVSLIGIILFFVTSSDSGSLVIDCLSANGDPDPPAIQVVVVVVDVFVVVKVVVIVEVVLGNVLGDALIVVLLEIGVMVLAVLLLLLLLLFTCQYKRTRGDLSLPFLNLYLPSTFSACSGH